MKNQFPYSSDRRPLNAVRRQPQAAWKRPRLWFWCIIATFCVNLLIAVVTVERHISFPGTTPTSVLEMKMDRPGISPLSSRWRRGQSNAKFVTERRIWHRMLLQREQEKERTSHDLCHHDKNQTAVTATATNDMGRHHRPVGASNGPPKQLSPFGFAETVRAYVRKHDNQGSTNESSTPASSSMYCPAPPSEPQCQSLQYTVVIYSNGDSRKDGEIRNDSNSSIAFDHRRRKTGNRYWRSIVVGAMKFLAYPSAQRVNLVLRQDDKRRSDVIKVGASAKTSSNNNSTRLRSALEDAAKQNRYAKRVLKWSRKGVVNVVSTTSLWDAIDRLEVPSESVLWIDGDRLLDSRTKNNGRNIGNGTVLEHRFRVWREAPNTLLIPRENSIVSAEASRIDGRGDKSNSRSPVCAFPLLHEMMMHTNYLCYLNHPVVGSELRNYTDSLVKANDSTQNGKYRDNLSWDTTTIAMAMLLFSIGDGYVVENADYSSDGAAADSPRFSLDSAAVDDGTLAASTEEISNYFGCPCSIAAPRFFPSNVRQCTSG